MRIYRLRDTSWEAAVFDAEGSVWVRLAGKNDRGGLVAYWQRRNSATDHDDVLELLKRLTSRLNVQPAEDALRFFPKGWERWSGTPEAIRRLVRSEEFRRDLVEAPRNDFFNETPLQE